ncbi:HPr(Ser) kinase/phosphatase [candidate division KSB1 bacterium]|nr:HPr(Ser) kinase/phosphatase [candidate division KSB1 bacterium]
MTLQLQGANQNGNLEKIIREREIHRPGLALSGFVQVFTYKRIQLLGNSENTYLRTLSPALRKASIRQVLEFDIPCIIITNDNKPPEELLQIADEKQIAIFTSPLTTTKLTQLLSDYLEDQFSPKITIHGSLVDVYGIGLLFTGRSGIGKSEISLDLVERGHQLVADDVVNIVRKGSNVLMGSGSEILQHHMEVRGLGIIDVRSIFGVRSVRRQKRIQVEVRLEDWDDNKEYDRIGMDEETTKILDVPITLITLPIFPGKNITVTAEVIALNTLMKLEGHFTAQEFSDRLLKKIQERNAPHEYLSHDYE